MMKHWITAIFIGLLGLSMVGLCCAESVDVRAAYRQISEQRQHSLQQQEHATAAVYVAKKELKSQIFQLRTKVKRVQTQVVVQQKTLQKKQQQVQQLIVERRNDDELMTNLTAAVRISAKQLQELLQRSPLTALDPQRPQQLDVILNQDYFPGLDDMTTMADLFLSEMKLSATVQVPTLAYTDSSGHQQQGPVLLVGPFLAVGQAHGDNDLLRYNPQQRRFSAIEAKLPWSAARALKRFLAGEVDSVPLDLCSGDALEQLARQKGFVDRVRGGGVLVWPILLLAVVAVLIGLERMLFLKRVHDNTDRTMREVNRHAEAGNWQGCEDLVQGGASPVYNVVRAGLHARHEDREILESILQEAILKELPRLERALPLLNIMGAIAPLLGLLGTVTGMISTFEVINTYGTGDPRMMSGGISVALVTTMLGLIVAIPIMLLHTLLSRQVEHIIGDMEEKSVALTNIIHRCSLEPGCGCDS
ncbi:MAG: MotA/TolQ/ExbB proton channel family protein [Deltaproteobacteria bacterium]|nr:MotA/TolQ/ExbB proton channel family protein [Deltaproteobacteria bacterium]